MGTNSSFAHDSQKTGFFLIKREMRSLVGSLSKGRSVLNCFSYTGGFSVYAAKGGAVRTVSVDISEGATLLAKRNLSENGFSGASHECISADVFDYLRQSSKGFDLIILDPPAFAKKKDHVSQAAKGYNDINRVALQNIAPGGIRQHVPVHTLWSLNFFKRFFLVPLAMREKRSNCSPPPPGF